MRLAAEERKRQAARVELLQASITPKGVEMHVMYRCWNDLVDRLRCCARKADEPFVIEALNGCGESVRLALMISVLLIDFELA